MDCFFCHSLNVGFSMFLHSFSSLVKLILNSTRTTFIQMCELISKSFNRIQSNANYSKMTNLTVPKGILNNCKLELQKKKIIFIPWRKWRCIYMFVCMFVVDCKWCNYTLNLIIPVCSPRIYKITYLWLWVA